MRIDLLNLELAVFKCQYLFSFLMTQIIIDQFTKKLHFLSFKLFYCLHDQIMLVALIVKTIDTLLLPTRNGAVLLIYM